MRCEEALFQLNARVDGELREEEAAALDTHLAECSGCGAAAEGLQGVDAELRSAFVPRRVAAAVLAERAVEILRAAKSTSAAPARRAAAAAILPEGDTSPKFDWSQNLFSLAAGFLLAVGLFQPWRRERLEPALPVHVPPIARLAVASGPVEVRAANDRSFYTCPPASSIDRESTVRTGPTARCEIALDDGNSLRLDCNTEVKLHEREVVEVNRGRLVSFLCPDGKSLEVKSGGGTIVADQQAQFAVDCQPQAVRLIVVDGTVKVRVGNESVEVPPGKDLQIANGKVVADPELCDAQLETAWVNSVLALRDGEHPELVDRVNKLLANVGAAKLSMLYEDELRRLGDDGVPPLLAYLDATRDKPEGGLRSTAARIVADVAESRRIADLIGLLADANSEVRFHAARGLERLTGRDQGRDARQWQRESWATCESAHQKWLAWWAANRDRYPAARREIPVPKSPPF